MLRLAPSIFPDGKQVVERLRDGTLVRVIIDVIHFPYPITALEMASGRQWRRRGLSVQRAVDCVGRNSPDNGSLGVGQFSVTPIVAAVVDEFLSSGESSKSPQSSSICNHNFPSRRPARLQVLN
jgi:hypothetical protein